MNFAESRSAKQALLLSVALTASAVSHADTVKVIFAAENALYGAGYDVGHADGWMDTSLRKAVRQYQGQVDHLRTSGNLDSETLTALGIANKAGTSISGNAVAKKADALAALGISVHEPRAAAKPKPQREKIVAKTFSVPPASPQPEEPKVVALKEKPEPAPAPAPVPEKAKAKPDIADGPGKQVAETHSKPVEKVSVTDQIEEKTNQPELPSADQKPSVETSVVTAQAPDQPVTATSQSAEAGQDPDLDLPMPDEPTAAGVEDQRAPEMEAARVNPTQEPQPARDEPNRSVFGTLFDFLFGWMV